MTPLQKYQEEKKRKEALEHRDVLLAISALMSQKEGAEFFEYLFKSFEVNTLPDRSMEGNILHEYLGFLRAGQSIYKLCCEASSERTGQIMAKIERMRYDDNYHQFKLEQGLFDDESDN